MTDHIARIRKSRATRSPSTTKCGHEADGNGFDFRCDLPAGHEGLHAQRTKLRNRDGEYTSTTNWGDDGLAPWATKYPENGTAPATVDVLVQDEGTIYILTGLTESGRRWLERDLADDATRWGDAGYVVEHRYVGPILEGAVADGLRVGGRR